MLCVKTGAMVFVVAAVVGAVGVRVAVGDGAQADYDRAWAPREKKAVTPALRAKLAEDLMNAAERTIGRVPRKRGEPAPDQDEAIQALEATRRDDVLLLCTKAYELGSQQQAGYAPAARALGVLQTLDPAKRLDSLLKLKKMYQEVYQIAPSKNLGIAKGYAAVNLQLGDEQLALYQQDVAKGALPVARQGASLHAISGNYNQGLEVIRAAMATIRPYARGKKEYEDFLESAAEVERELLESQKLLGVPLAAAGQAERNVKTLEVLRDRLRGNANDHDAADRIVRMEINELDDPAAVEGVLKSASPAVRDAVALMKKPVDALTPAEALAVASWCAKSNDNPASPNRVAMDLRVHIYAAAFEKASQVHDGEWQQADALLRRAKSELAAAKVDEERTNSLAAAYVAALEPAPVVAVAPAPAPEVKPEPDPVAVKPEPVAVPVPAPVPAPETPRTVARIPVEAPTPASDNPPVGRKHENSIFDFGQD